MDTIAKTVREFLAQEKARVIQIIDLYGAETITTQFLKYLPSDELRAKVAAVVLELDEQLWVRSLPHAPGNKPSPIFAIKYWPDQDTQIIFERYILNHDGTPISRVQFYSQQKKKEALIKEIKKLKTKKGIIRKLWRILWVNQRTS